MDIKAIAVNGLKNVCKHFVQDLEALPEESYERCFGGKARTVADLVYEVNLVNEHVGQSVRGEEQFKWPEGWIKAPANLQAKGAVIESFKKSFQNIIETFDSFTAEELQEPYLDEGQETTRFERARFVTLHLWYHSGQLNFIQTLLGDDEWHWN